MLNIWAINQIPINFAGCESVNSFCFDFITCIILSKDKEFQNAVNAAIRRELSVGKMKIETRVHIILPLILKVIRSGIKGDWTSTLREFCSKINDPIQQNIVCDQVVPMIMFDRSINGIKCSVCMLDGLCEAGLVLPKQLITLLLEQSMVLQQFLPSFMKSVCDSQSDSFLKQIIDDILKSPIPEGILINAIFSTDEIPRALLNHAKSILASPSHTIDTVIAIARNREKIAQHGLASPKKIAQLIWRADIFSNEYFDDIANFFENSLASFSVKDALSFLKRIIDSKSNHSVRLCHKVIQWDSSTQVTSFIVQFMCSFESFRCLEDWLALYKGCINSFNSEQASDLTQVLIQYATNEIKLGHVYQNESKDVPGEPMIYRKHIPSKIRGWRIISSLFEALSYTPIICLLKGPVMSLVEASLEYHTFPLVTSISLIIIRIIKQHDSYSSFLSGLYKGNSSKKQVFLKLIPLLIPYFDKTIFINIYAPVILELTNEDNPNVIRCMAIKVLPYLSLIGREYVESGLRSKVLSTLADLELFTDREIIDSTKEYHHLVMSFKEKAEKTTIHKKENDDPNLSTLNSKYNHPSINKSQKKKQKNAGITRPQTGFKIFCQR